MKIHVLGGGPGGLYVSILLKKAFPSWDLTVVERNPPGATYGWGIVFSDRTLGSFREADYKTYKEITERFVVWDVVEVRQGPHVTRCGGNGFSGMSRKILLQILQRRAAELGVEVRFRAEISEASALGEHDLLIGADGSNSTVRRWQADVFRPSVRWGKAKYVWFGTTRVFDAFTFLFRESEHGLFQAHVYPHVGAVSTFVVECDEAAWSSAGLDHASTEETLRYCERVFAEDLGGESLLANKSEWLSFPTIRNGTWRAGKAVLLGDAAHTAHFSIGSGTKLAMEDAIALANSFERRPESVETALAEYELERRPVVEALQEAALESADYFESTRRYFGFEPLQFAFQLLTRSSRTSYDELRRRDSSFVDAVDRWFLDRSLGASRRGDALIAPPPTFTPLRLRGLELPNRIVACPGASDTARDGLPDEGGVAELARLASGGPAIVLTPITAVSAAGRITPGCPGIYRAEHARALARLVDLVRSRSDARFALQLGHAGPRGSTRRRTEGLDRPLEEGGWPVLGASPLPHTPRGGIPKEMDRSDMDEVRDAFVRAARIALEAGCDLLQLHFGQGYLVWSFLSPITNRRRDEYGGTLDARSRYPLEIFDAVRATWPDSKPLSVALSATDWVKDGFRADDAVALARLLRTRGCDAIHVLTGQTLPSSAPRYGSYFSSVFADRIRNEARLPTLSWCTTNTSDEINSALAAGRTDLCVLSPLCASEPPGA